MGHYVVTGACGYIGSVLSKKLKEHGHKVTTVDLKATYPLYTDDHWANTCFSSELFLKNIIEKRVDGIFHLAAHSLLGPSVADPLPYFINNAGRTAEMVHTLVSNGWQGKFVFSSTAATYGAQKHMVIEDSPRMPINPYGISKLHAEDILEQAYDAYGFSSVIFRFFNVSGADGDVGQDRNEPHILTQMSKAAKAGTTFKLYGDDYHTKDGTCVRDYVHVLDVVNAHLLALDLLDEYQGTFVFNLGKSHGTSNLELVEAFRNITGIDLDYEIVDRRPGDPDFLVADSSRFTQYTGYMFPESNLQNIISSQWEWFNYE